MKSPTLNFPRDLYQPTNRFKWGNVLAPFWGHCDACILFVFCSSRGFSRKNLSLYFLMVKVGSCWGLQLKDLTVPELKLYLTTHKLPLTGKKELIINRILTHLGKWWSRMMSEFTTAFNRIIRASFLRIGCRFGDLHNSIAHQRQLQFSLWLSECCFIKAKLFWKLVKSSELESVTGLVSQTRTGSQRTCYLQVLHSSGNAPESLNRSDSNPATTSASQIQAWKITFFGYVLIMHLSQLIRLYIESTKESHVCFIAHVLTSPV